MTRPAFSAEIRERMIGWRVCSGYQIPQNDGRKLKQCTIPSDPWHIVLHNGRGVLDATRQLHGTGATLDDAVLDALSGATPTLKEALSRLESAVDGLIGAYRCV